MTRLFTVTVAAALLFTACSGMATPGAPTESAAGGRIGTINLMCGGESFRVAFLDTHAAMVSADGATTTELPVLQNSSSTEPGVTLYTNGMQTFAKSGGRDTPTVIRFARGRMAFQDCAIAQN